MSHDSHVNGITPSTTPTIFELSLVGLHPDGEHLVLTAPGNTRFLLAIDDKLLAAVRKDRSRLEYLQKADSLSPRDIQARVRAGETAQAIAQESGMTLSQVERLERPVLDERAFIAKQARKARVGSSADAPELGDLVTDRLAARNVDLATLSWDAIKKPSTGWQVLATFTIGSKQTVARWSFDPRTHVLRALEDEARWLSETAIVDEPIPQRRHLSAVHDAPFDVESHTRKVSSARNSAATAATDDPEATVAPVVPFNASAPANTVDTESLLEDLAARRGTRQPLEPEAQDDKAYKSHVPGDHDYVSPESDSGREPARIYSLQRQDSTGSVPAAVQDKLESPQSALFEMSTSEAADEASQEPAVPQETANTTDTGPQEPGADSPTVSKTSRKGRKSRSQMPSWDEIVFGAKPE